VAEWLAAQDSFRETWHQWAKLPARGIDQTILLVGNGEQIIRKQRGLYYRTYNLERLLLFSLAAIPTNRLRKCIRPDCATAPYFLARHLNQSYCSRPCSGWAQREWKRKWWKENKVSELKKRKSDRKKRGG
jgi:hypothetical protein